MKIKAHKIIKKNSEEGDHHPDGSTGIILGKMGDPSKSPHSLYMVMYDDSPINIDGIKYPAFTVDFKLDLIEEIEYEISDELGEYLKFIEKELYPVFKFEEI